MENENGNIIRIFVNGQESVWSEELQARYLPIINLLERKAGMKRKATQTGAQAFTINLVQTE